MARDAVPPAPSPLLHGSLGGPKARQATEGGWDGPRSGPGQPYDPKSRPNLTWARAIKKGLRHSVPQPFHLAVFDYARTAILDMNFDEVESFSKRIEDTLKAFIDYIEIDTIHGFS